MADEKKGLAALGLWLLTIPSSQVRPRVVSFDRRTGTITLDGPLRDADGAVDGLEDLDVPDSTVIIKSRRGGKTER